MKGFSSYHPTVNFLYFCAVILFSMFFMHPLCLMISFACSFSYFLKLNGRQSRHFFLIFILPMMLIATIINPLISHQGATILTHLPNGSALTMEAIIYGFCASLMLSSIIMWFSCYNKIMSSDKFIYLFGRNAPALSLIFSMVLRFVPRFTAQLKVISAAQECSGQNFSHVKLMHRIKNGTKILSALVTWALENSIETADSMKSRGWGLPGRTTFSIYRFEPRDKYAIVLMLGLVLYVLVGSILGETSFEFYPKITPAPANLYNISVFSAYLGLCICPLIFEISEDLKWKYSTSKT